MAARTVNAHPSAGSASTALVAGERLTFGPGTVRETAPAPVRPPDASKTVVRGAAERRDWGYAGLLAFTAVLLLRPQDHIPQLNALHLAEVCALVGIGRMLFDRVARGAPLFRLTTETFALIAFGMVIVATVPFSFWPGGALQEFFDSYLKALVVFVLMVNTVTTVKRLDQITWVILVCVGYIAARGVFDYARGVNLVEGGRLAGPVGGMFGNPNDLAMNMVTLAPVAAVMAMSRWQPRWRRLSAALIVVLMIATAVFSKSRGGGIGLLIMLGALMWLGRKVRPQIVPVALGAILIGTPLLPASFWTRMASIVDPQQDKQEFTGSREARRLLMQEGIDAFLDHPITGVGAGQFKNYNPAGRKERWRETHNALIQVAAETGLAGLLLFSFLIVRAGMATMQTRRMLRRPRHSGMPDPAGRALGDTERRLLYAHTIAMSVALLGWFTCAMFASVANGWTFYYLLALIVAARELTRDRLAAARVLDQDQPARQPVSWNASVDDWPASRIGQTARR
jgi:O-antigen ligase